MGACFNNRSDADELGLHDAISFHENLDVNKVDSAITTMMNIADKKEQKIIKVLLLGTGSSGKSTLFRQIQSLFGDKHQYQEDDGTVEYFLPMEAIKKEIKTNLCESIIKLLTASIMLSSEPYNFEECEVDQSEKLDEAINVITEELETIYRCDNENDDETHKYLEIAAAFDYIWNIGAIQETYRKRHYYCIIENIHVFLEKAKEIYEAQSGWEPDRRDVILSRIKTIGVVVRDYVINETRFHLYDVGGQRNERSKWLSLFDNVNAVIYVSALNGYCKKLFEDESVNDMTESLALFGETSNSKYFQPKNAQLIIFLNKNDCFVRRLRAGISLDVCFGDSWTGNNYGDRTEFDSAADREMWFGRCCVEAIQFISKQFLAQNKNEAMNPVHIHVTTATERKNIKNVFDEVRSSIIMNNLVDTFGVVEAGITTMH